MSPPAFWDRRGPVALALLPFGLAYGVATAARMRLPGATLPLPVLCVGNFTVGGSGKTPTVEALVRRLKARGERPFVLSRGYGGMVAGPHRVDPARDDAARVGDEPMLLASHGEVIVGADRRASAALAQRLGATCLVMDDGLQNPSLAKTLSIAVVDAASGVGNGFPLPAGPLRAPLGLQLPLVDAVLIVGEGKAGERIEARARGKIVLRANLVPTGEARALAGQRVLAFCGIGRPEKFRRSVEEVGATIAAFRAFPDHHEYTRADAEALIRRAAADNLPLVTTRKDHMRLLAHEATRGILAGLVNVLDITLAFRDEAALDALLARAQRPRVSR